MLSVGVTDKAVSFAVLLLLPVMFGVVVRAEEKSCFKQSGTNVEYTGKCLESKVTLRVPATKYTGEISYGSKTIIPDTKVNFVVGGCTFDGTIGKVGPDVLGITFKNPEISVKFPITLTVSEAKGVVMKNPSSLPWDGCKSAEFVKKEDGNYTTDFAIDLDGKLPDLSMVINDASDHDEKTAAEVAAAAGGFKLWYIGLIAGVSFLLLVVVGVIIFVFVCLRRRKKKRAAAAAKEAAAKEAEQIKTAQERSPKNKDGEYGNLMLPGCGEDRSKSSKREKQYAAIDPQETTVEKKKEEDGETTAQKKKDDSAERRAEFEEHARKIAIQMAPMVKKNKSYPLCNFDLLITKTDSEIAEIVRTTPVWPELFDYLYQQHTQYREEWKMMPNKKSAEADRHKLIVKKLIVLVNEVYNKLFPNGGPYGPLNRLECPEYKS